MSNYKASGKCIALIKEFEGLELDAYLCPAGVWTIGYGHTDGVRSGDKVTEKEAEKMLVDDLKIYEQAVNAYINEPITQGIFDALVAFSFNVGTGALYSSTLLRLLNKGEYASAGDQLLRWNKADGKELAGLTRRRQAERKLFYSQPFP